MSACLMKKLLKTAGFSVMLESHMIQSVSFPRRSIPATFRSNFRNHV